MEYLNFSKSLKKWYLANARELPWRKTRDPYKIWLSEVILQQTRVEQGLSYYYNFIENYPTIDDLANTEEIEVLKSWQGLGYYSRARNLHATAKIIQEQYQSHFPKNYDEIIKLKGIGEYTAAAIVSFAYQQPYAVLDGNVFRVVSRIFDIELPIDSKEGKKTFKEIANDLLDENHPDIHNQAMMELGALICTPTPKCDLCPVREFCLAYQNKTIGIRPVKEKKIKIKERYFNYLFFHNEKSIVLKKRIQSDIWKNLYDFPLLETEGHQDIEQLFASHHLLKNFQVTKTSSTKHILTHQRLNIQFINIKQIPPKNQLEKDWLIVNVDDLETYPLPKVIEKFLQKEILRID